MKLGRHVAFWLIAFLVLCALLWLLSDILLPFVAGMALAYVLAPLADRLARLGLNRTLAALLIVAVVVLALLAVALLIVPILVQQGLALIADLPEHLARARELLADPSHPWLKWIGSGDSQTLSEFLRHAGSWMTTFAA